MVSRVFTNLVELHPIGDPDCPEDARRAKKIHHTIEREIASGMGYEDPADLDDALYTRTAPDLGGILGGMGVGHVGARGLPGRCCT